MKRIFVYEFLSGGGLPQHASTKPDPLLAMGVAMRDAVVSDLLRLDDVRVSVATREGAPTAPSGACPVVPRNAESPFDFVGRIADAHHLAWIVAPETDDVLAAMADRIEPARWLGCTASAIALASRKRATLLHLGNAGLATPLAFEHAPEITRWIVKPDDGAGAVDTRLHDRHDDAVEDWSRRSQAGRAMSIEPWVEGRPLSLSLLCDDGHAELLAINEQRIDVDGEGTLSYRGVDTRVVALEGEQGKALDGFATRIAGSIPGLRGYVGVDLVWHARRGPVVIEVNPRLTCAYVGLSAALGRNLGAELIALALAGTQVDGGMHVDG
ncbi:MAG: ATP-grasp domain-containing protein [Caldimonas sp.]